LANTNARTHSNEQEFGKKDDVNAKSFFNATNSVATSDNIQGLDRKANGSRVKAQDGAIGNRKLLRPQQQKLAKQQQLLMKDDCV